MMKKLLVLLMVLGITSMASAATIDVVIVSHGPTSDTTAPIDPTSEITINESEWIDVDIIFTPDGTETLAQLSCEITLAGMATLDMTDLTLPAGAWDSDPAFSPGVTEVVAGKQYIVQYGVGMSGSGAIDVAVDHLLIHCDDWPDVATLAITADVLFGGIGSMTSDYKMIGAGLSYGPGITITQVPEPMTVALLGLGGLFLLRRRR